MLAVRPEYQKRGVGRALKEYQRQAVARVGGETIYWTFDPLVARNAHLNFNVLGVRVSEYVPNMYGETGSDLHAGIGTDRLIVQWPVDQAEAASLTEFAHSAGDATSFASLPTFGDPDRPNESQLKQKFPDAAIRIVVPADIASLQRSDPSEAARWRLSTRDAFQRCLAGPYGVHGFRLDGDRGYYVLSLRYVYVRRRTT
jgi:predicted GNAT superfamily acetyltransferase